VANGRVVVTHDADFGKLAILQNEPLVGIVYLRPGHIDPKFTVATIQVVLTVDPELVPPFIAVAKRTANRVTIRVRALGP
jgi:predicted nuclease of predicted toxin-antitoxin system